MIMRKIKKGTFLDLILSDISEDEVRRTASKMAIAAKLAKTLEKRNMSQKEFSRILGKRPSEISKWLSGKHNFTTDTLSDIEHALDIHLLDNREEVAFESTINHRITIEVKPSRKNMFIPQYEQESYTIDNMAKTVPVNIKISLLNLTETLYRFNYDYDYSTIKPDDLKVDFIHSFKSDQEKGEFGVEVKARYKSAHDNCVLAELGVYTNFRIDPFSAFIKMETEKGFETNLPDALEHLCEINVGALRGIFFTKLKGTPLEKYLIPLIPMNAIISPANIKKEE